MSVGGFRASMYESLTAENAKLYDRLAEREAEIDNWAIEVRDLREYIELLENQIIDMMGDDDWLDEPETVKENLKALFALPRIWEVEPQPVKMTDDYSPFDRQDSRNHLSEPLPPFRKLTTEEATAAWQTAQDEPIPLLPVDPEEQRRMNTVASDGKQAMIYRRRS